DPMKYWLMKSEPDVFGVDHLAGAPKRTTAWEGVRNYQARNMLRDDFREGDLAFFYHSSCEVPGIAGIVKVVREAYPDPTQFDRRSEYYDAKSTRESPRWFCVDVRLEKRIEPVITLPELREHADGALREMVILKRGNRLSVTPVTAAEWRCIVALRE
ncbi:MAG TPA: EVE domain-containing protein, partial [Steroidobacteraceae bacterium]|nr:EVE domain-containing protein [Steroidobacteraceae bacterium]